MKEERGRENTYFMISENETTGRENYSVSGNISTCGLDIE